MDLTGATTRDGRARNYGQELVLPISPFDPKFTYRADVMKQGTAMMYVKDADLMKYFGGDLTVFDKEFENMAIFSYLNNQLKVIHLLGI